MGWADLREYIGALEEEGEVQRIRACVDPHLEVGAVIRRSMDLKAPAPLFESLKGFPEGYRIFGAPIGVSGASGRRFARVALALGLSPETPVEKIIRAYTDRLKRPLPPERVPRGPCKEEVHVGDAADLEEFPAPYLHQGDGGRYIGTWHIVVSRDPDSEWVNWGVYRLVVLDKHTLSALIPPSTHLGLHFYQKHEPRGRPMEFAVAIGTDPVIPILCGTSVPAGVQESHLVGALRQEPVEVVRCETVGLDVPATSEIVIEGRVLPGERRAEGPFAEYTGYRAPGTSLQPVFRVSAITHRKDPILPASCTGVPVDDCGVMNCVAKSGGILQDLQEKGLPVRGVFCPPEGVGHLAVISTRVPYPYFARHLANAVWGTGRGRYCWYLIIVDEDVDVTDNDAVLWALTTRCHPDRGVFKMPDVPGRAVLSFASPQERERLVGAYLLLDCTWPKDWPEENIPEKAAFDVMWPEEIQKRVLSRWGEYGYGG